MWAIGSGRVRAVVSEGTLDLEGCSQAVLPWRPPETGWEGALGREFAALRAARERREQLVSACAAVVDETAGRVQGIPP